MFHFTQRLSQGQVEHQRLGYGEALARRDPFLLFSLQIDRLVGSQALAREEVE